MVFEVNDTQCVFNEGECCGCGMYSPTDEVGLCAECASKLDRDLIRQRDWEYSITMFAVPAERREELRSAVIREYGKELELITPSVRGESKTKGRKRRGKRKKRGCSR